jgi:hypothetical protein
MVISEKYGIMTGSEESTDRQRYLDFWIFVCTSSQRQRRYSTSHAGAPR